MYNPEPVKKKILVICSNPQKKDHLCRELEREGYHILSVTSGSAGLEVLCKYQINAVVCVQCSPDEIRNEFLEAAYNHGVLYATPVIDLYEYMDEHVLIHMKEIREYIPVKCPIEFNSLCEYISSAIESFNER